MNVDIDISNVILETKHLVLRPVNLDDLDDLYCYAKEEGVGEMAGWRHHKNIDESKKILEMFIENKNIFAITKNGKMIGTLGIEKYNEELYQNYNHLKGRELGIVIGKDYWHHGFGKEAMQAVIDYLFNVLNLDFIACCHFSSNDASCALQESLGFKVISEVEEYVKALDENKLYVLRIKMKNER